MDSVDGQCQERDLSRNRVSDTTSIRAVSGETCPELHRARLGVGLTGRKRGFVSYLIAYQIFPSYGTPNLIIFD